MRTIHTLPRLALVLLTSALACGAEEGAPPESSDDFTPSATAVQPSPGVYSAERTVSGFPLGKCGFSGTAAQRSSDMNHHNAPYVLAWADDSCLTVRSNPEGCGQARDKAECERWRAQLMKIIFPMDYGAVGGCLTPAQRTKLESTSNMRSIDISSVSLMDAAQPNGPRLKVGYFRIFRHNGHYQYEMVAAGNRAPFFTAAVRAAFPGRSSMDGMKLCFDRSYAAGLALPAGRTPLSCVKFTDQARAGALYPSQTATSTPYGFYDPSGHAYCPVAFASKP